MSRSVLAGWLPTVKFRQTIHAAIASLNMLRAPRAPSTQQLERKEIT